MTTKAPCLPPAERIVEEIVCDLNDRAGLGFDGIDREIQEEIRRKWIAIVNRHIKPSPSPPPPPKKR